MTSLRPASVLVVEDDRDLSQTISDSLDAAGFAAAQAVDERRLARIGRAENGNVAEAFHGISLTIVNVNLQ